MSGERSAAPAGFNETQTVWLFRLTGLGTAAAGALCLAPQRVLSLLGIEVQGVGGLFFAQHWAVLVACLGALLVRAATRPALRRPVVTAALFEKAVLIAMLLSNWAEPALAGLRSAIFFDGLCVLLYAVWLGRKPSTDR